MSEIDRAVVEDKLSHCCFLKTSLYSNCISSLKTAFALLKSQVLIDQVVEINLWRAQVIWWTFTIDLFGPERAHCHCVDFAVKTQVRKLLYFVKRNIRVAGRSAERTKRYAVYAGTLDRSPAYGSPAFVWILRELGALRTFNRSTSANKFASSSKRYIAPLEAN